MVVVATVVAVALLAGIGVLQVLVAAGRPLGRFVWGGQHDVLPRRLRIGSLVAVALYVLMAALLLSRAGVLPGGDSGAVVVGTWVLFGYFVLGVVLNGISRSRPERLTMTPANVLFAAATLVIALD